MSPAIGPRQRTDGWQPKQEEQSEQDLLLVYEELRKEVGSYINGANQARPLNTRAIVGEVFKRLTPNPTKQKQESFCYLAAHILRLVLVQFAREADTNTAAKSLILANGQECQLSRLIILDDELKTLELLDKLQSQVVLLAFFTGMDDAGIARVLDRKLSSVQRERRPATLWLSQTVKANSGSKTLGFRF